VPLIRAVRTRSPWIGGPPPPHSGSTPPPPPVDIRAALVARLLSNTDLTALVAQRIRPGHLSINDTLPAIAYRLRTNPRSHGLTGFVGQANAHAEIDIAAWSLADCIAAKQAIEASLDGQRWFAGQVEVSWSEQLDEVDLHEPPVDASDRWLYRILVTYRLKHRVPV
jgi:hypothetical protein